MRVLIVGAGIAGLTLAALLRQRGLVPDIVERAPSRDQAGHVLGLYPLGSRVLHGLGAWRSFAAMSEPTLAYAIAGRGGKIIRRFEFASLGEDVGALRMLARSDLLRLLDRAAQSERLRLGVTVEEIAEAGERVRVTTSDGAQSDYDLVVGADGIHSQVREFVSPRVERTDTHWDCRTWWAPHDARLAGTATEFWGAGRLMGLYSTHMKLGAVACAPRRTLANAAEGRRLGKLFARFGDAAHAAMAAAGEDMFVWPLVDARAETWRRGRVVLLGDAACAFLPTAGIGASMAMESASVLAEELARCDAAEVPRALAFFEARRRKRVEAAQDASRKLARIMFVKSRPLAWARNRAVGLMRTETLAAEIAKMFQEPI